MSNLEGNDETQVIISTMEGSESEFPEFMTFNASTSTISFSPNMVKYRGRTFYFVVVVKEKNSDTVMTPYYAQVRVRGDRINFFTYSVEAYDFGEHVRNPKMMIDASDVDKNEVFMPIQQQVARIVFSDFVSAQFVTQNFFEMFDIYLVTPFKDKETRQDFYDLSLDSIKPSDIMATEFTFTIYSGSNVFDGSIKADIEEGFDLNGLFLDQEAENELATMKASGPLKHCSTEECFAYLSAEFDYEEKVDPFRISEEFMTFQEWQIQVQNEAA